MLIDGSGRTRSAMLQNVCPGRTGPKRRGATAASAGRATGIELGGDGVGDEAAGSGGDGETGFATTLDTGAALLAIAACFP